MTRAPTWSELIGLAGALAAPPAGPSVTILLDERLLPDKELEGNLGSLRSLLPDARVVLMTSFAERGYAERAVAGGAWAVLDKPIALADLLRAVEDGEANAGAGRP